MRRTGRWNHMSFGYLMILIPFIHCRSAFPFIYIIPSSIRPNDSHGLLQPTSPNILECSEKTRAIQHKLIWVTMPTIGWLAFRCFLRSFGCSSKQAESFGKLLILRIPCAPDQCLPEIRHLEPRITSTRVRLRRMRRHNTKGGCANSNLAELMIHKKNIPVNHSQEWRVYYRY